MKSETFLVRLLFSVCLSVLPHAARADVVISSDPTQNVSCSGGVCTATASDAVLNVSDLQTMLGSSNVKLAAAGEPVDVDINAAMSWVSASRLTLDSYHSIHVNQPVAITGGGGLTVVTNDGGSGGEFAFAFGANVNFWSLASPLTINGSAYTLVGTIATLAGDVAANPSGAYAFANNYDATPDGTYSNSPIPTLFGGQFQGLGNTISNLSIVSKTRRQSIGLFSASRGAISNVVLQNVRVVAGSESFAGGIIGENDSFGLLFGDHVGGTVTVKGKGSAAGGLAGVSGGTILQSSSSTDVSCGSGPDTSVGGLVGLGSSISESFATGNVKGGTSNFVGGLIGEAGGVLNNSYATGSVAGGQFAGIGGFIGYIDGSTTTTSYSTGSAKGPTKDMVGGFIGYYTSGTETNSYWDTTTSKNKNAIGGAKGNIQGVTGLTTQQFQSGLPGGFDPTIWAQNPSINNGLPYLADNPPR